MGQSEVCLEETLHYVWFVRLTKIMMIIPVFVYILSVAFNQHLTAQDFSQLTALENIYYLFSLFLYVAIFLMLIGEIHYLKNRYRYLGVLLGFIILYTSLRDVTDVFQSSSLTPQGIYSSLNFLFRIFYSLFAIYTLTLHKETIELFTLGPETYSRIE